MNSRTSCRTKSPLVPLAPLTAIVGIVVLLETALGPSTVGQRSQALAEGNGKEPVVAKTLFGFTPFPYDQTLEALAKTHQIVTANSTIYALHYDDGIPWKEALADAPFPKRVQRSWDDQARSIPKGHKVYLGLAPLDKDRRSLAPARGEQDGAATPMELRSARLDDSKVKQAYLSYARRAVKQFRPDFLNLGIEADRLSALDWLMDNFDQFGKPHATVETNDAAERLAHGTALLCGWLIRPYGAACLARAARYPQT
jgi:hypothetical protein